MCHNIQACWPLSLIIRYRALLLGPSKSNRYNFTDSVTIIHLHGAFFAYLGVYRFLDVYACLHMSSSASYFSKYSIYSSKSDKWNKTKAKVKMLIFMFTLFSTDFYQIFNIFYAAEILKQYIACALLKRQGNWNTSI